MDPLLAKRAAAIRLLALDVDGVLTDGKLHIGTDGEVFKSFNSLDGQWLKLLLNSGVDIALITGRTSAIVQQRALELGISTVLQSREDKLVALNEVLELKGLALSSTAYVGDDVPDLPAIRAAGLGVAVSNSANIVAEHADYCTQARGGEGAAQEVCELIMQAQGTLEKTLKDYLA